VYLTEIYEFIMWIYGIRGGKGIKGRMHSTTNCHAVNTETWIPPSKWLKVKIHRNCYDSSR